MQIECPLCKNLKIKDFYKEKDGFKRLFYRCESCLLIFLDPRLHLPKSLEKSRYEHHNNTERTDGYEKFLRTLIDPLKKFIKPNNIGLDFGCGPYPMMCEILKEDGYKIEGYDPYFAPNEALLHATYDYITCCEVAEHFNEPVKSFKKMDSLLRYGGILAIKTSIFNDSIDFKNWYYIKDDTHISLYSKESMQWICSEFNYEILDISDSVVLFKKNRGENNVKTGSIS